MDKVKEAIQVKRDWMADQMQAQSTTPLCVDPVVKVTEIHAATKVKLILIIIYYYNNNIIIRI